MNEPEAKANTPQVITIDANEYRLQLLLDAKTSQISFHANESANLRADLGIMTKHCEQLQAELNTLKASLAKGRIEKLTAGKHADLLKNAADKVQEEAANKVTSITDKVKEMADKARAELNGKGIPNG